LYNPDANNSCINGRDVITVSFELMCYSVNYPAINQPAINHTAIHHPAIWAV